MIQTDRDYLDKCTRELGDAIAERNRLQGLLAEAKERVLRLMVHKNNAWGELEMAKAAAKNEAART